MKILLALLSTTLFTESIVAAESSPPPSPAKVVSTTAGPQYLNFIAVEPVALARVGEKQIGALVPFISDPPGADVQTRYQFRILQMTTKSVPDALLREVTSLSALPATTEHGPALKVAIDASKLPRPNLAAEYALLLEIVDTLAAPVGEKAAPHQLRTVRLIRPSSKLDVPSLYTARQVNPLFGRLCNTFPSLVVKETSQDSDIEALALTDVSLRADVDKLTTSRLRADSVKVTSGATAVFSPNASGPFPLGELEGKLELNAPELTAPVIVPYKIRASRPLTWIFFFGVLGLLLGIGVRKKLATRKELLETKRPAEDLLASIAEAAKPPDELLRTNLNEIATPLEKALEGGVPATLSKATTDANKAFPPVVENYKSRLSDCQKRLGEVLSATSPGWHFPAAVNERVQKLREQLAVPQAALAEGDANGADAKLKTILQGTVSDIASDSRQWRDDIQSGLKVLENPSAPLTLDLQNQIQTGEESLPKLPDKDLDPNSTTTDLAAWLESQSALFGAVDRLLKQTAAGIEQSFAEPIQILRRSPKLEKAADDIVKAYGKLNSSLGEGMPAPKNLARDLREQLPELQAALGALPAMVSDSAQKAKANAFLAQKLFSELANLVVSQSDHRAHAADAKISASLAPRPPARSAPEVLPSGRGEFIIPEMPAVVSPSAVAAMRAKTERGLWFVNLVQTLMAAAIYLVFLYFTYADHFIGFPRELFVIFFGAFIWDLGFDATMKKVSELKA